MKIIIFLIHFLTFYCCAQNNTRLLIQEKGNYGFIDETGKKIVQPIFEYANHFREDLALVKKDGFYGFINRKGKLVIKNKYDFAYDFENGTANAIQGNYFIVINKNGKEIYKSNSFVVLEKFGNKFIVKARNKNAKQGIWDNEKKKLIVDTTNTILSDLDDNYCISRKCNKGCYTEYFNLIDLKNDTKKFEDYKIENISKIGPFYIVKDTSYYKGLDYYNKDFNKIYHDSVSSYMFNFENFKYFENLKILKTEIGLFNEKGQLIFKFKSDKNNHHPEHKRFTIISDYLIMSNDNSKYKLMDNKLNLLEEDIDGIPLITKDIILIRKGSTTYLYDKKMELLNKFDFYVSSAVNLNYFFQFDDKTENYFVKNFNNNQINNFQVNQYFDENMIDENIKVSIEDEYAYLDKFGKLIWKGKIENNYLENISQISLKEYEIIENDKQNNEILFLNNGTELTSIINFNSISPNEVSENANRILLLINGYLSAVIEAIDYNGNWVEITSRLRTIDDVKILEINYNQSAKFNFKLEKGNFKTQIRFKYIENPREGKFKYSNPIEYSINPSRFFDLERNVINEQ